MPVSHTQPMTDAERIALLTEAHAICRAKELAFNVARVEWQTAALRVRLIAQSHDGLPNSDSHETTR